MKNTAPRHLLAWRVELLIDSIWPKTVKSLINGTKQVKYKEINPLYSHQNLLLYILRWGHRRSYVIGETPKFDLTTGISSYVYEPPSSIPILFLLLLLQLLHIQTTLDTVHRIICTPSLTKTFQHLANAIIVLRSLYMLYRHLLSTWTTPSCVKKKRRIFRRWPGAFSASRLPQ